MTSFAELDLAARTDKLEKAVDEIRKIGDQGERTEQRVAKSTNAMSVGFGKLAGMIGTAVGTLASGAFLRSAINEAQTFETAMFRVEAIIRATGGVAGRSADQLREQARQIALGTLESTEGVLKAQQTLLTFRNVQGDVFDRTIRAATDMTAALGGDLNSATMQLAKALENPTEGLSALSRSGTVFTQSQKDMVKAMVEAGNIAGAQTFILAELEAQYGGTAVAAAQGLAGAQDTLAQRMQELKLALADQLGLLSLAVAANNAMAGAVLYVTDNLPAFIDGLRIAGAVVVGLASTQIPAFVVALATATGGMSAAAIASGVLSGALRVLGGAVALAGGPFGLLLGILGGAAAAMVLFRDNTATAAPILDEAKSAVDRINAVLANSSEVALPAAARATLNLTNENIKLAKSAYAAAEAELAKAKAAAQATADQMGAEGLFTGTGMGTSGSISANEAAIARLTRAQSDLLIQQDRLSQRINEGQLSLSGASEAMAENQRRAVDLTVTMGDLNNAIAGSGGGAGSGGADPFQQRLEALQQGLMTEREVVDAWYQESMDLLNDRRAMELLGEEDHKQALLRVEEEYQRQVAALRGATNSAALEGAATFFGSMAEVAQAGGAKLAKIAQVFGAAQALINTYLAASQALADPTVPFWGKFAAVAKVVATGLGLVSAIKGGGGAGAGGGGASAARQATPERAPQQRFLRIEVDGDGMFADMWRNNVQSIADAIVSEQRFGGTTIVVGR